MRKDQIFQEYIRVCENYNYLLTKENITFDEVHKLMKLSESKKFIEHAIDFFEWEGDYMKWYDKHIMNK